MFNVLKTQIPLVGFVQRSLKPLNSTSSVQLQQVRWRKRRTDPKAKSKIGRVREPTPWDPWERAFFIEKVPHYNSTLRAVRHLFKEELLRKTDDTAEGLSSVVQQNEEEEEFQQLLKWNESENAKISKRREEKLDALAKQKEEEKLQRLLLKDEKEAEEIDRKRLLVLAEQEACMTFITKETLEAAIDAALVNPKNYNFLIKKSGEPTLPADTAWQPFRERTLKAKDDELVEAGESHIKTSES